jgi:putative peptide zinc metalloprotease protein
LTNTENLLRYGNKVDAAMLIILLAFVFCSSMLHELGHASAIKHFGLRHGGIGFGLYLNFPVLYTDVTAAWRLPRGQRCVVNIGGVYFQTILLIVLVTAYIFTGADILRYMSMLIILGFILTLNPFFRFDGYWLATDILGVANLRKQTQALFTYYLHIIIGRKPERPHILTQTKSIVKIGIIVYSVTVNIFMCYYFFYIIPLFIYGFAQQFPAEIMQLVRCLSNDITPPMALLHNLFSQLMFMAIIGFLIYRIVKPLYTKLLNRRTSA